MIWEKAGLGLDLSPERTYGLPSSLIRRYNELRWPGLNMQRKSR